MKKRALFSLLLFVFSAGAARGGAIFYTDPLAFNNAVLGAGLGTGFIDFESVAVGDYSSASGLTAGGLNFVGPFSPYFLRVVEESGWGVNFAPGTGNTLTGVGQIDITLAPNTRAFGANVGQSFVWATGGSSSVQFRLSTGDTAGIATNPAQLFPFFGFVSDVPVGGVQVGFGASSITIDNLSWGTPAEVPEPTTLLMSAGGLLAFIFGRKRRTR